MFLWWGNDLIQIYNDAYRPSLGNNGKHPHAIGQRGFDCWPEIWDFISPLIEQVKNEGKSVWYENLLLPIYRNGEMQDVYWTFSYSPVYGDDGAIEGVLVVCNETTENIQNLQQIQSNKSELEFAIEAAELGTWDFNPVTGKFTSNARLKSWFGLLPQENIPLSLATDVIIEQDRQRVIDAISEATRYDSGGKYETEYTIVNPKTGQKRVVLAKGRAMFDADKQPYRFNGTLQDISANKKAERKISEARQLTDLAIKSVGIGTFKVNFSENKIEYTPEFAAILTGNKNKKDITRKSFIAHIHPDDEHLRAEAVRTGIETGEFHYAPRVVWEDGSVHRVSIMGAQILDEHGKPAAFSGTARDITLQETQQLALEEAEIRYSKIKRESEALFHNVTNSSPTGLWLSDTEGGLTYLNKTLVDWTGMPYEDLLGNGWANAIIEEDRQKSAENFLNAIQTRTHYDVQFRIQKSDGEIVWCRAAGDPYQDEQGNFAGYSGFCMDINEIIIGRKAISDSEALFRSIIEQAPVATCLFAGRDMKIEVANDIMLDYWGKDTSVLGLPLEEAVPELKGQPFLKILDDVFTTGITYTDKAAPVVLALGGVIGTYYFDFTYKALRTADGVIYGVMDMAVNVTQQVLAQQQIEEHQKRLLASFEESPVGIATIDKENLTFRTANSFYGELVGRKPQDIVNKPLMEVIPELAGQGFDDLLREVIATGVAYVAKEVAVKLLRNNTIETIYVDLTYQPRKETNDEVTGILVVATDVTQQVLTRRGIEASEEKFRSIIMDAPVAMAVFRGRELRIEVANDIILNYLGKDKSIIGMTFKEAVPQLEAQGFFALMDEVYTTGISYEENDAKADLPYDGVVESRYYNYVYTPLFDANETVYAIMLTAFEVTDQVVARKNLEDTQTALRNAIELAELATWKLDIKKGTYSYSERFMEWLGFNENTKGMQEAYNLLPKEYRQSVADAVENVIRPGSSGIYDNEHPIVNRLTGQTRIIHAAAQILYDAAGNPEFLSGTAQDVTKERKLQQELEFKVKERTSALQEANAELATANSTLEISNQELQQFAYIASHDLQEPIRKIAVFMQMLESSLDSVNQKSRGYMDKINTSTQRMTNLVRDVLSYSQLSGMAETFEKVDLNHILHEIINEFELAIEQKNATIHFDELPVIEAIPLQMSQLFGNLVSNSLKYSRLDVDPEIAIRVSEIGATEKESLGLSVEIGYCRLEFSDNGIGFEQEYAEKIFNIFQRLHGKREYVGTGIGLAVCRKIVQNHHGLISAQANTGSGALFTVVLPLKQYD